MAFAKQSSWSAVQRCAVLLCAIAAASGAPKGWAADDARPVGDTPELVTLHSGFSLECSRREILSGTTVRLYLRPGNGVAANYMDVASSSIAAVEPLPVRVETLPGTASEAATRNVGTPLLLERSGAAHNVNVALLAAVVKAESGGNSRAVSRTGARGLMQLMPATAADLQVQDSFSPEQNVNGGSTYLDRLLTRYHDDPVLAVAAYNAGPAAVDRYHGVPPFRETRAYVARVIREFNRLAVRQTTAMPDALRAGR